MKKIIVFILIVCLCLPGLVACGSSDEKGAIISVYLSQFPQTLDPAAVQISADSSLILNLLYQPLTSINSKGKVTGALAKSWYGEYNKIDEEYTMYFELNTTMWNDGIAVSADDVIFAWKRILRPEFESPYAALLYPIKNAKEVKAGTMTSDDLGIYADDDKLLRVVFENDYDIDLFAETVACIALSPLREDIIEKAIKDNVSNERTQDWDKSAAILTTNGAFRLQSYEEGTRITLERNAFYYREEDDSLDKYITPYRINCQYQYAYKDRPDEPTSEEQFQLERYNADKLYYLGNFTKETYSSISKDITTNKLLSTYTYYFNTTNSALSNAKARQALSIALDRNEIVSRLGTGEIALNGFVPGGVYDKTSGSDFRSAGGELYSTSGNTEQAKTLLSEAGVRSGTELTLTYMIPYTKTYYSAYSSRIAFNIPAKTVAEYAKEVWESLGLKITLVEVYADNYQQVLSDGDFDIIGLEYVVNSTDAFSFLAPFSKYSSGNKVSIDFEGLSYTPHYTGIESDEYDTLIDSVLKAKDRAERTELLHQAEELFVELCPATALYQLVDSYAISNKLSNVETNYFGFVNFNKAKLKDYQSINSREADEVVVDDKG